ncbi:unnamed protein product, partial [marine sediment metagenome]
TLGKFGETFRNTVVNRGLVGRVPKSGRVSFIVKSPKINDYFYYMDV